MTALAVSLLIKFWWVIAGFGGALWWGIRQRRAGAAAVRAEQARADQRVRDIADEIADDIHTMTPEQRRAKLRGYAER